MNNAIKSAPPWATDGGLMIELPKRPSLVEHVVDSLRRQLLAGEWREGLPAERPLCDRLQISRPTLREALEILRREGLIRFAEDGRKRVPIRTKQASPQAAKLVAFVTADRLHMLWPSSIFLIDELRRHLQDAGLTLEVRADPRLKQRDPTRVLQELVQEIPAGSWVLHRTSAHVQRWFVQRQLRVIVQGSCHEGIRLPSIDVDHRAVARHAAGLLRGKGHRHLALLVHQSGLAGDLAREHGFLDAFRAAPYARAKPTVVWHDGSVGRIHSIIRTLFDAQPPPTAVMVSHAVHLLSVMTELLNAGIRIPADVSLMCIDDQTFLEHVTPSVARYRFDWPALAARLSRMAVQLAKTGVLTNRPVRLIPPFQPGDSLAAPAPSPPRSGPDTGPRAVPETGR